MFFGFKNDIFSNLHVIRKSKNYYQSQIHKSETRRKSKGNEESQMYCFIIVLLLFYSLIILLNVILKRKHFQLMFISTCISNF